MDDATQPELVELTAKIVSAYVSNNSVVASELPHLISETHAALSRASGGAVPAEREEQKPKVPVKKSVMPDYLICLEDGKKFKSLKRHLRTHYNLSPEEYREKWGLAARLSDGGAQLCACALRSGQEDGPRHAPRRQIATRPTAFAP